MTLVDTSVLVDFLKRQDTEATRCPKRILAEDEDEIRLCPWIVQDVLQGARDDLEWRRLRSYLTSQRLIDVRDRLRSHVGAARIYFDCRRKGLTIRKSSDCLVAQTALEHEIPLLHDDRDFDAIRRVRSLKTLP